MKLRQVIRLMPGLRVLRLGSRRPHSRFTEHQKISARKLDILGGRGQKIRRVPGVPRFLRVTILSFVVQSKTRCQHINALL